MKFLDLAKVYIRSGGRSSSNTAVPMGVMAAMAAMWWLRPWTVSTR